MHASNRIESINQSTCMHSWHAYDFRPSRHKRVRDKLCQSNKKSDSYRAVTILSFCLSRHRRFAKRIMHNICYCTPRTITQVRLSRHKKVRDTYLKSVCHATKRVLRTTIISVTPRTILAVTQVRLSRHKKG